MRAPFALRDIYAPAFAGSRTNPARFRLKLIRDACHAIPGPAPPAVPRGLQRRNS